VEKYVFEMTPGIAEKVEKAWQDLGFNSLDALYQEIERLGPASFLEIASYVQDTGLGWQVACSQLLEGRELVGDNPDYDPGDLVDIGHSFLMLRVIWEELRNGFRLKE